MVVHDTRSASPITEGANSGVFEATELNGMACILSPTNRPPWTLNLPISVVGDSYVQVVPATDLAPPALYVHEQQECDDFTDGLGNLPAGEALLTAAPGGLVTSTVTKSGISHLNWYRYSEPAVTFAPPFHAGTLWLAVGGDAGIVAFTLPTETVTAKSAIRFMPWKHPGRWTTLLTAAPRTALACTPPLSSHVTCTEQGRGPALITLNGGSRVWLYAAHPGVCRHVEIATAGPLLAALETSNSGVCTAGKLYQLEANGRLVGGSSKRLWSVPGGIHGGLGGILVSTVDQHYVMRLKNVNDAGVIAHPAQGY